MNKIDIDKFVCSLIGYANDNCEGIWVDYLCSSLQDQGLEYKDGEIAEINHPQSDKDSDKELTFEREVSKMLYVVSQSPLTFEGDPDFISKNWANKLLAIAKKQLEGDPEFLYTVTRKAAERARKEFMEKAKKFIRDNYGNKRFDDMMKEFNKYMEE